VAAALRAVFGRQSVRWHFRLWASSFCAWWGLCPDSPFEIETPLFLQEPDSLIFSSDKRIGNR
jgi:hypothetical protein